MPKNHKKLDHKVNGLCATESDDKVILTVIKRRGLDSRRRDGEGDAQREKHRLRSVHLSF